MNGFLHYFLSALDPTENVGFSRAFPELLLWFSPLYIFLFVIMVLPSIVCWLVYLVKPAPPPLPLPTRAARAEPFVSVVIAGRNEAASIGQCIRAALLCGYANLEVIFVDDHSDDDSVAVARRAARRGTRHGPDAV